MSKDNSQGVNSIVEKYLTPIAVKLGQFKFLIAVRDGITVAMPLIIAGSIFTILSILPIPGYVELLNSIKFQDITLAAIFGKITNGSFGILGLMACFGVVSSYAEQYKTDGKSAGVIAIASFFVVTPSVFATQGKLQVEGMPYTYLGSKGLFIAIIIGLSTGWLFQWFINNNIQIHMPETVPPAVSRSFSALIPGVVIIALWGIIYGIFQWTGLGNIHDLLLHLLSKPLGLLGDTLVGTMVIVCLNGAFWFAGIHGGVVSTILSPIWLMNTDANRLLFKAGKLSLAHGGHIITQPFIDNFVFMGGSGATIGLVLGIGILVLMKRASKQLEVLAPLTIVPGMFNINEPTMFGIPIVLNISLLIPFALAPVVNTVTTYIAMSICLVPLCDGAVIPWAMPPIISGFLATNSIAGSILQVVNIIIDILIYLPFLMVLNKQQVLEEAGKLEKQ